jgi:hypothetical protein
MSSLPAVGNSWIRVPAIITVPPLSFVSDVSRRVSHRGLDGHRSDH